VRIALDTNVLAYAEGIGDQARRDITLRLLELLIANLGCTYYGDCRRAQLPYTAQ